MTKQELLAELQARKTKAEAMGPEVIKAHQALYSEICDEIYRLQASGEDPDQQLAAVTDEILQLTWPVEDYWNDCEKHFPDMTGEVKRLEQLLTDANNRGHTEVFRWYLPLYRRAWIMLNLKAKEFLEYKKTLDQSGFTPCFGPTPFDEIV